MLRLSSAIPQFITTSKLTRPSNSTTLHTTITTQPNTRHKTPRCPPPPPPSPSPAAVAPAAASAQKKPPAPAASNPPCTAPAKRPRPRTQSPVHAAAATNALPVPALARVPLKKTQSPLVRLVLVERDQRVSVESSRRWMV